MPTPIYKANLSTIPPGVGQSKKLWSPDLFDDQTGTYPITPRPAAAGYPLDAQGRLSYFEGADIIGTPFIITTGDAVMLDNALANSIQWASQPDALQHEQALWSVGQFTLWAGTSSDGDLGDLQYGTGWQQDYPPEWPSAPTNRVIIDGTAYALAAPLWDLGMSYTKFTSQTGYFTRAANCIALVGGPDLRSKLYVGKRVYFA